MTALDQSEAAGFYKRMNSNQNVPEIDKMQCAATCVLDPSCKGFTVNLHPHPQCATYDDEILKAISTNISVKGNFSNFYYLSFSSLNSIESAESIEFVENYF